MSSIDKIKAPIASEMQEFEKSFRASLKTNVSLLGIITSYILKRKGKQMRPMFVFLTASLNGKINKSTHNAAALIELMHTATLVHDDVVDESFERRGFFSVNALWKNKISVLIGDYFLAQGLLLAVRDKEFRLLEIVSDAVKEMSEGELLQIEKARRLDITEEIYFEIIRKKTATLLAACAVAGSVSAGADEEKAGLMKSFGEHVGIAFQLKDDLFDFQKKNLAGKPTGNDIKEKKLTLPLIQALKSAAESEKRIIMNTIRDPKINSKKINEVMDFVLQTNGIQYTEEKMINHRDSALNILKQFPDNPARESLEELVNYTVLRKK
ncbi:MAG: polyprenyl synthetase family protein [Bacteroidales bacterium]|nr:polyprenyl synthetase family protein [Bacteroidales bacterium]